MLCYNLTQDGVRLCHLCIRQVPILHLGMVRHTARVICLASLPEEMLYRLSYFGRNWAFNSFNNLAINQVFLIFRKNMRFFFLK